jgi:hypothetical protein
MIFMPSIWTLIAGVSVVAILAAFQWWLSGHARRFARMHRSTARSFREPRPSGMVRAQPSAPAVNLEFGTETALKAIDRNDAAKSDTHAPRAEGLARGEKVPDLRASSQIRSVN